MHSTTFETCSLVAQIRSRERGVWPGTNVITPGYIPIGHGLARLVFLIGLLERKRASEAVYPCNIRSSGIPIGCVGNRLWVLLAARVFGGEVNCCASHKVSDKDYITNYPTSVWSPF